MLNFKAVLVIFFIVALSACSSTDTVRIDKKPLVSDHQLFVSLLKRPTTADQVMMMQFAAQRTSDYQNSFNEQTPWVDYVMIKGERTKQANESNISYSTINDKQNRLFDHYKTEFITLKGSL